VVSRLDEDRIGAELGGAAADSARAERLRAAARELRLAETLAAVDAAAARLGLQPALLKGRALVVAGHAAPGARPSGDLDLLVAADGLRALRDELRRNGFASVAESGYDHQLAPLSDPHGEVVDLHRHLPGVRLGAHGFATWHDLERAGLLETPADRRFAALAVPSRELLIAHALVHVLAQHGLSARYPGWLLIGDLLDLGTAPRDDAASPRRWQPWIERELSREEIDAALGLAASVAGAEPALEGDGDAARLGRHFVACALDADYAEALKSRWLESPVTEHSRFGARARLLLRALVPPAPGSPDPPAGALGRAWRWLARPFELAAKAARSRSAARRVADGQRPDGSAPRRPPP